MKFTTAFAVLASLASMASAAPFSKRIHEDITDVQILQYALTLEHLENFYYSQFLSQFSQEDFLAAGLPEKARGRFEQIAEHEAQHVSLLSGALGPLAVQPCTYKFPVTDVKSFVALATVVENIGVSAYLGAAAFLVDKTTLTIAGSILTTEARHQAWMNSVVLKESPWSGSFDTPLDFNEVFSIASAFITECPATNPALPFKAFPTLAIADDGTVTTSASLNGAFVQIITGLGSKCFPVQNGKVEIPKPQGFFYAVLTTSSDAAAVRAENTLAGPMIFNSPIDSSDKNPVLIL